MKTSNFPRSYINETYGRFPFVVDQDDWLISIADLDAYNALPKVPFERIIFFSFADCEDDYGGGMTDAQAEQMADFIKKARELNKNVWVNCHMGMCRSGAVVEILGLLGWEIVGYGGQPERIPNVRVFNKLRRQFDELRSSWD